MESTRAGSRRSGDCGGDVFAWHWSMPYRTLGNPRTQVFASGAMHVGSVHGGALDRSPSTSRSPAASIDMRTEPVASVALPRFQALPTSWAVPMTGPPSSHPVALWGPTRHAAVHRHVPVWASALGSRGMRAL